MPHKPKQRRCEQSRNRHGEICAYSDKVAYVTSYRGKLKRRLRGYPRQPQETLDLHRCKCQEALSKLTQFIRDSINARLKTIRIVTGRGLHSVNGKAILRNAIGFRLEQMRMTRTVHDYKLEKSSKGGSYMVYLRG